MTVHVQLLLKLILFFVHFLFFSSLYQDWHESCHCEVTVATMLPLVNFVVIVMRRHWPIRMPCISRCTSLSGAWPVRGYLLQRKTCLGTPCLISAGAGQCSLWVCDMWRREWVREQMEVYMYNHYNDKNYATFLFWKVTPEGHRYFRNIEMREEGGTPDIVGSIRAGLAMQLKMVR